ncbi:adenosylcobinamide-GDP ribazoletransferase [Marinobacter sp. TBZ242]|uniref:Adenosylcobinamide-GDP ribazoletransferase n=1 Tax=Marinobacter azerbaijanicus TaxID=3050455 RepID=A0ABT7ICM4_9GAMM|nr:adenosylcobinamide-GDP ribazoletransferase [Marinobacter sp. TBZ242]MDL0431903.1 adenosylcobinamide-GDP ribazoletransferase [Marinobacter sp. TBZ242]
MSTIRPTIVREWQAFWLAIGFLTRIPMLVPIDYSPRLMNQCSVYFPLVGLVLGVIYAGLYVALAELWSPLVCLVLVTGFHLWITGAFHEDGLADSVDALGGGYSLEARLGIMKDSRIGTYGTVVLVIALALKVALLVDAYPVWLALVLAPMVSRLAPLLIMGYLPYVTDPDNSKSKPVAEDFSRPRLAIAALFTALATLFLTGLQLGLMLWGITAALGVALVWGTYLHRQLGGYTGDTLGASVVFAELVMLLGLAI